MELMDFLDKYAALMAALGGGVGVKVIDRVLSKRSERFNEASQMRDELRLQISDLRDAVETHEKTIDEWRHEADNWRTKYWEQVAENVKLRGEFEQLRGDFEAFKAQTIHKRPET